MPGLQHLLFLGSNKIQCRKLRAHVKRQVCDQPHPLLVAKIVDSCTKADLDTAYDGMRVRLHAYYSLPPG